MLMEMSVLYTYILAFGERLFYLGNRPPSSWWISISIRLIRFSAMILPSKWRSLPAPGFTVFFAHFIQTNDWFPCAFFLIITGMKR